MTWTRMASDLNPTVHLWGILKRKVEQHKPSSKQQLKEIASEEWQNIYRNLVSSMLTRTELVFENKVQHTRYQKGIKK